MRVFVIFFTLLFSGYAISATDNAKKSLFTIENTPEFGLPKNFKGSDLCAVAEKTAQYIEKNKNDGFAVHQGKVFESDVTLDRVEQTLDFLCETYREDVKAARNSRLHDNTFLAQHFDFYRWQPDHFTAKRIAKKSTNTTKAKMLNAITDEEIFLTKYYTKLLTASPTQTAEFNQALYALPFDEQGLTLEQADKQRENLTRFKFSRQQVIRGELLKNKLAEPLVWLSEEALHDVLLQGTGVLKIDGKVRYFNVHRNNGVKYDYSIGKREQARYWYFAEVPSIMGYGERLQDKIAVKPFVTFAGNVADLGLGKLFMVSYESQGQQISQLGVLADQGGAFDNNLFQLDYLVDSYYGWTDYHQANKHLPDYAKAWLMLLKVK